ncbi:MAG TPA: DUF2291 domain-containing protein [Micromonosporaceae bacterium]|nr:DUF2291 domain-containing protein [Micromonosporaceae bacterium]
MVSLASVLLATTGCTKVPGVYVAEKAGAGEAGSQTFNAASYAEKNWSKVGSTVTEKAVDAKTLLAAIQADPVAAGKQYGVTAGVGSAPSIMIKGAGTVGAVDQSQGPGRMQVDLDPADGTPDLSIAIGPVFLGTAVRDAVGFISFGEFPNQIEFANVATELNNQARTKVVAPIDMKSAQGKKVTFAGAFQMLDPKNITVTPVQLAVTQ